MYEEFTITSSRIRVTDPCYTKDIWCSGVIENCLNGKWVASTFVRNEGNWGYRNAELRIWHSDYNEQCAISADIDSNIDVGVDSGQAGFFDDSQYPDDKKSIGDYGDLNSFYGKICDGTSKDVHIGHIKAPFISIANIGFGVCCSSGFGDGGYQCFIKKVNDVVIAAKIIFISDEEYEEECDDDYQDYE
jgi:hypothetical protein